MKRLQLKSIPFYIQMTVFLPVVMVLLLITGILVFERMQQVPPTEDDLPPQVTVAPVGVLCVLREEETVFYTVITVDPTVRTVEAVPLTDETVDETYRKSGAAVLLKYLQERGEGVDFYVDVTFEQMREWLQYLGNGVEVTLQEDMVYSDATGLAVAFPSGTMILSANQTADMLRAVAEKSAASKTVAAVWESVVHRYIIKERNVLSDYTALTDIGDTDIRIYDLHKALPYIEKMAETQ